MNIAQVLSELRINTNKTEESLSNMAKDSKYMFCQHIRSNDVLISAWFRGMPSVLTAQFLLSEGIVELRYGRDHYTPEVLAEMETMLDNWLSSDLRV